jgi:replicative DNA helicase Mcm
LMMADPPHNYFSDGVFSHNCIDEIDKMRPEDRSAIHEAMEQQTISIAKAGIVVQLNARSSILAAANPSFGRYVPQRTVAENINDLPVTILSRFDLIFTLIDRPDEMRDKSMTEHILSLHQGVRLSKESIIDPILLKKFLYYVRKYGKPDLGDAAAKEIEKFFLEMRAKGQGPDSPVPITMRQLEAVIRLSEARAKLALKKEVTKEDVAAVIRLLKAFLSQVGIDQSTGKMDIDTLMVGHPKSQGDKMSKLFDIFMAMEKENEGRPIKREAFVTRAGAEGIEKGFVEKMIGDWSQQGVIYEPRPGELKKA